MEYRFLRLAIDQDGVQIYAIIAVYKYINNLVANAN